MKSSPWLRPSLLIIMYAYHKLVAKNGSHKLTAHFLIYCTYRVHKIPFNGKAVYYRLLLLVVSFTMHSRVKKS